MPAAAPPAGTIAIGDTVTFGVYRYTGTVARFVDGMVEVRETVSLGRPVTWRVPLAALRRVAEKAAD